MWWRRVGVVAGVILGLALMGFSYQPTGEGYTFPGAVAHKVMVAHWLETDFWVNPQLLLLGAVIVFAVVAFGTRGLDRPSRFLVLVIPVFILLTALGVFMQWGVLGHPYIELGN